jgi:phage terminase small subunit
MSRPPKPLHELELNGALERNPKRYAARLNPPRASGKLGRPPEHFDADEKAMWKEISRMAPDGLLGGSDRHAVEALSLLMVNLRKNGIGGRSGVTSRDLAFMRSLWDALGLTPAGRSRLNLPKKPKEDISEFAEFDKYFEPVKQVRRKQQAKSGQLQ